MTFLIWLGILAVAAFGGIFIVKAVLRLAQRPAARRAAKEAPDLEPGVMGPDGSRAQAALRGGLWIGILERALIAGFILAGFPTGIAVVVAIKGLGRYPELTKDRPEAAERFMIGTLASLLTACLLGWTGVAVINWLS